MPKPETVELSQDEQKALMQRLTSDKLTDGDRELLGKCLNFMTWLQCQLETTKISLDKLRKLFNIIPARLRKNDEKKI
jgi:hypothetical protein